MGTCFYYVKNIRTDGVVRQLAVELDTYMNEYIDPDGNHIGIDTTSMSNPVAAKSLNTTGIDLKSGRNITFRIDFDGAKQMLRIYIAYAGQPLISILNQSIILSKIVPNSVYVGFTASTGTLPESHQLLDWVFASIPTEFVQNGQSKGDIIRTVLVIVVPTMALMLLVGVTCPFIQRILKKRKMRMKKKVDIESRARSAANVPQMFTYKQLQKATRNFSKENLLGKGGFGSVYKGTLQDPTIIVAVKKISATSHQGIFYFSILSRKKFRIIFINIIRKNDIEIK